MKQTAYTGMGISLFVAMSLVSSATADRLTSPNYIINGNLGGSFGGSLSSSNYKMSAIGGETVVGAGAGGSYIIDQQTDTSSIVPSMNLAVQPGGLAAYYPLDENTGTTTADASSHQHNGSLSSPAAWYASGKLGSAVDMNGSGAVLVPDNSDLPSATAMTVEAWVNQAASGANQTIASHWDYHGDGSGSGSWALQTGPSNNLRIFVADSQGDLGNNYVDTATNTWNNFGSWHHVVMTYDGTQAQSAKVKVYVDGALVGSTAYGTLPGTLQNSSGALSIGSFPGLGRSMGGAIDQVKLFNRALSSAEVSAEYAAQNSGISAGLTLGTITNGSTMSLVDAIVRTNAASYNLSVQQDHDLQSGSNTIPAISGSINSPQAWNEGVTKGLGFTLTGAPTLDSRWSSGGSYAAVPAAATTFYSGSGHVNGAVDVVNLKLRLDTSSTQPAGSYANSITYTGTTLP
jgi:hypothetical protein